MVLSDMDKDKTLMQVFQVVLILINVVIFSAIILDPTHGSYTGQAINISAGDSYVWRNITLDSVNGGSTVEVQLHVEVREGDTIVIIEENYPADFTVADAGVFNSSSSGVLRWLYFSMNQAAPNITLNYTLQAPNLGKVSNWTGEFLFEHDDDSQPEAILGDGNITVVYVPPEEPPGDDDPGGSPVLLKGSPLLLKGSLPPPSYEIFTTEYNFSEAVYRVVLFYNATSEMELKLVDYEANGLTTDESLFYDSFELSAPKPILEGTVYFKVVTSWLEDFNIDPDDVPLFIWTGEEWDDRGSIRIDEDETYTYYRAGIDDLGPIAIAGYYLPLESGSGEEEIVVKSEEQSKIFNDQTLEEAFEDDPGGFGFLGWLLGILVLITGATIFFYNMAHKRLHHESHQASRENLDRLKSYVEKARESGKPDGDIKAALEKAGWKDDQIDSILH